MVVATDSTTLPSVHVQKSLTVFEDRQRTQIGIEGMLENCKLALNKTTTKTSA